MTKPTNTPDPESVAAGLTKAQREALIPFVTFSDQTGREMIGLGLLQCDDGVWTHTKFGWSVRRALQAKETK